jgi:hypothetical protein
MKFLRVCSIEALGDPPAFSLTKIFVEERLRP